MQCFVCGEQMRVVLVEPHVVDMRGFELRTFQCVGCGDLEKRPVFDRTLSPGAPVSNAPLHMPEAIAPPPPPPQAPAASNRVRSLIGGLVRLRGSTPHP
ncbi:MAG TPA: hypothetical protein VIY51_02045 [Xanthobacteraceae bacterium]